jgi:hypothetical protein
MNLQMTHKGGDMAAESTAMTGYVAAKLGGSIVLVAVVASAIGFFVFWPKTRREGISRIATTILGSMVFGPGLAIAAFERFPKTFEAAVNLTTRLGIDPLYGWIAAGAPWLVLAGIPVWWIGGALALWFEKRKDKDIAELAHDVKNDVVELFPARKTKP